MFLFATSDMTLHRPGSGRNRRRACVATRRIEFRHRRVPSPTPGWSAVITRVDDGPGTFARDFVGMSRQTCHAWAMSTRGSEGPLRGIADAIPQGLAPLSVVVRLSRL